MRVMSLKFYINNLNTFVGQALFHEIRNDIQKEGEEEEPADAESAHQIFGMFIDRDSSEKPAGIAKMLKVTATMLITNLRDPSLA